MLHKGWSSTGCSEVMEIAQTADSTLAISIALLGEEGGVQRLGQRQLESGNKEMASTDCHAV